MELPAVTTLVPATLTPLKNKPAGQEGRRPTSSDAGAAVRGAVQPDVAEDLADEQHRQGRRDHQARQKRQTPSVQPATLSFDLEFDTAEGETRRHSRRTCGSHTHRAPVHRADQGATRRQPPPAVRFVWGTFTFQGIVTQLTEDLDYFSPTGGRCARRCRSRSPK